jgi:triosephosphate isomerase
MWIEMKPILLINLKTYEGGTGKKAVELAKIASRLENGKARIVFAVQPTDIAAVSRIVKTFAQHIDPIEYGSNTGFVLPEAVKEAGAKGTIINHSEHRLELCQIEKCIQRAKALGLETVCCATDPTLTGALSVLSPNYIAIEPPELIGSGRSVTQANPEAITNAVNMIKRINPKIPVLCGAGVQTGEDVSKALELGAIGVLVASGVAKASDPRKAMEDLISGFG